MDKTLVFSNDFIDTIKTKLDDVCKDGSSITKTNLCSQVGLHKDFENSIGVALSYNLIPGYTISKGRGIGKEGVTADKKAKKVKVKKSELTEEFVAQLEATLDDIIPRDGKCISREKIAAQLDSDLDDNVVIKLISEALEKIDNYKTERGRYGGVRLIESLVEIDDKSEVEENSSVETETLQTEADNDNDDDDLALDLFDDIEGSEVSEPDVDISSSYINPNGPLAQLHAQKRAEKENQDIS